MAAARRCLAGIASARLKSILGVRLGVFLIPGGFASSLSNSSSCK
jgi:hypothetical protein